LDFFSTDFTFFNVSSLISEFEGCGGTRQTILRNTYWNCISTCDCKKREALQISSSVHLKNFSFYFSLIKLTIVHIYGRKQWFATH
jgi:hypothetical protein